MELSLLRALPGRLRRWRPGLRAGVLTVSAVLVRNHGRCGLGQRVRPPRPDCRERGSSNYRGGGPRIRRSPRHVRWLRRDPRRRARDDQRRARAVWSLPGTSFASRSGRRTARSSSPTSRPCAAGSSRSADDLEEALDGRGRDRVLERDRRGEHLRARPGGLGSSRSTCRSGSPARAARSSGAYEIYEDAAPIETDIARTRRDVLLIVGAMALGLLALLFAAFSGASRRLTVRTGVSSTSSRAGLTAASVAARSDSGRSSRTPPTST